MSAQDETLDRYHALMRVNAEAHVMRAAREAGILRHLLSGQATAAQITAAIDLEPQRTQLLLDALVAMKALEKYGDDYALAAVTRLLCQYDADLGDALWEQLLPQMRGNASGRTDDFLDAATATQWIHTGAAKQAAELLDIGGQRSGLRILDLGCGSAVWSAAMAFVDPTSRVTAVDTPERIVAARRTIESIELLNRYSFIEEAPEQWEPEADAFEMIILGGRFASGDPGADRNLLRRLNRALVGGGELVIIDLFRGPSSQGNSAPSVNEAIEALRLAIGTHQGTIRSPQDVREALLEEGYNSCQFAFLAASRQGWGLLLATKKG